MLRMGFEILTLVNEPQSVVWKCYVPLQWRHNGHNGVSNHQPHHCWLNRFCGRRSKKTSKLRVTGLCVGPGTGEFPAQMASNAENILIWWRHYAVLRGKSEPLTVRALESAIRDFIKRCLCPSADLYIMHSTWLSKHTISEYQNLPVVPTIAS